MNLHPQLVQFAQHPLRQYPLRQHPLRQHPLRQHPMHHAHAVSAQTKPMQSLPRRKLQPLRHWQLVLATLPNRAATLPARDSAVAVATSLPELAGFVVVQLRQVFLGGAQALPID